MRQAILEGARRDIVLQFRDVVLWFTSKGRFLPTDFGPKLSKEKRLAPVMGQERGLWSQWARGAFIPSSWPGGVRGTSGPWRRMRVADDRVWLIRLSPLGGVLQRMPDRQRPHDEPQRRHPERTSVCSDVGYCARPHRPAVCDRKMRNYDERGICLAGAAARGLERYL